MSRYDVSEKVVFMTGGARGIGLDAARRLADRGARIALVDVDPAVEASAAAFGDRAAPFVADVTDPEAIGSAVDAAVERFGGIDVVVANAGISGEASLIVDIEPAAFERVLEINLLGVWRTVKAALPHVIERRGYVLPVASVAAILPVPLLTAYGVSKAGVEAFSRGLRIEVADTGTRVGCAYFSVINTDMVRGAYEQPAIAAVRHKLPAWLMGGLPVGAAGEAIARGVERRAARVYAPRWVPALIAVRGLQSATAERAFGRTRVAAAARAAPAAGPRSPGATPAAPADTPGRPEEAQRS